MDEATASNTPGGPKSKIMKAVIQLYKSKMDLAISNQRYLPTELELLHTNLCSQILSTVSVSLKSEQGQTQWLQKVLDLHYEMYAHRNRAKLAVLQEEDEKIMREAVAEVFVKVFQANKRRYAKAVCFEHMSYPEALQELRSLALEAATNHYLHLCNFSEHKLSDMVEERFAEFNGQFREACFAIQKGATAEAVETAGGIRRRNAVRGPRKSSNTSAVSVTSVSTTDDSGFVDYEYGNHDTDSRCSLSRESPLDALSVEEETRLRDLLQEILSEGVKTDVVDTEEFPLSNLKTNNPWRQSAGPSRLSKKIIIHQRRSASTSELPSIPVKGFRDTPEEPTDDLKSHPDTNLETPSSMCIQPTLSIADEATEVELILSEDCGNLSQYTPFDAKNESDDRSDHSSTTPSSPEKKREVPTEFAVPIVEYKEDTTEDPEASSGVAANTTVSAVTTEIPDASVATGHQISSDSSNCVGPAVTIVPPVPRQRRKLQRQSYVEHCEDEFVIPNTCECTNYVDSTDSGFPNESETASYKVTNDCSRRLVIYVSTATVYIVVGTDSDNSSSPELVQTEPAVLEIEGTTVPIFSLLEQSHSLQQMVHPPEETIAQYISDLNEKYGKEGSMIAIYYPSNWTFFQIRRLKLSTHIAGLWRVNFLPVSAIGLRPSSQPTQHVGIHVIPDDFHVTVFEVTGYAATVLGCASKINSSFPECFIASQEESPVALSARNERKSRLQFDEIIFRAMSDARTHIGRVQYATVILQDDMINVKKSLCETLNYFDAKFYTETEILSREIAPAELRLEEKAEEFQVYFENGIIGKFELRSSVIRDDEPREPLYTVRIEDVTLGPKELVVRGGKEEEVHHFTVTEEHVSPLKLTVKSAPVFGYRLVLTDANGSRIATTNVTYPYLAGLSILSMSKHTDL